MALILACIARRAIPGVKTRELDDLAEKLILEAEGKPSFKGYKTFSAPTPYPASLCVSINDEVVHGIPSDKILKTGDVVGLDIGMEYEGLFTDTATTILIAADHLTDGPLISPSARSRNANPPPAAISEVSAALRDEANRLITATKKSLEIGIAEVKAGVHVGDIGYAIQKYLEGEGFGVIRELVGHGVGRAVHEEPEIPNWGMRGEGPVLREGEVIALEPMATEKGYKVKVAKDRWTWVTRDGSRAAHFEHTLVVTKNGSEVLTRNTNN